MLDELTRIKQRNEDKKFMNDFIPKVSRNLQQSIIDLVRRLSAR